MHIIFELKDKAGRKIHLSRERWRHICKEHPEIIDPEDLIRVVTNPKKITESDRDETVSWYYLYNKERRQYLKVSVKYLNSTGYIITAHYTRKIE